MTTVETLSYPVQIFVAGDWQKAEEVCGRYCDDIGLCVTVTRTTYVYTGGSEEGVIVGLINYGRFPSEPRTIFSKAKELALRLIAGLGQQSATVHAPDKSEWLNFRDSDGTATAAACEDMPVPQDCQARAESIAQNKSEDSPNVGR